MRFRVPVHLFASLACVVALMLPLVGTHAAPIGGTLTGKVVMKTVGTSLPSAPLTVTLLFYNPGYFRINDEAVDNKITTTAPDGSFTFTGMDTSAAGVYRVLVMYRGVVYEPAERDFTDPSGITGKTRAVRFENNAPTATTEVPIYELATGEYQSGFTVAKHAAVINEVRPRVYSVVESYQITNATDRTFVGTLNPDGSMKTGIPIAFTAPTGATTISTSRIDLLAGGDLTGQKLTLPVAIPPGTSDVTCNYDVQGGTAGIDWKRTLDYAATQVQVLVSDTKQPITSPNQTLKSTAPIQAPQATVAFRPWNVDGATAGQVVELLIGPSPAAPSALPTATPPKGNFYDTVRANITAPALLAIAALCFILMIVVLRMPTRAEPAKGTTGGTKKATASADSDTPAKPAPKPEGRPTRTAGRPHDYDVDEADKEIEAVNAPEATRDTPRKKTQR